MRNPHSSTFCPIELRSSASALLLACLAVSPMIRSGSTQALRTRDLRLDKHTGSQVTHSRLLFELYSIRSPGQRATVHGSSGCCAWRADHKNDLSQQASKPAGRIALEWLFGQGTTPRKPSPSTHTSPTAIAKLITELPATKKAEMPEAIILRRKFSSMEQPCLRG